MKLAIAVGLLVAVHALVQPKAIQTSCPCDVSSACDDECCCDAECTTVTEDWKAYHKCDDDGFGIPLCSGLAETDVHVDDLYSGLKTIYTIVKRLFCLDRTNNVDPTSFFAASDATADATLITEAVDADFAGPSLSAVDQPTQSLASVTINGLFHKSGGGICQTTNNIRSQQNTGKQKCRVHVATAASIDSNPILSSAQLTGSLGSVNVYSMDSTSSFAANQAISPTASCAGGDCSNVVRFVKIFLTADNAVSTAYSYIVVGQAKISDGTYASVEYDYEYLTSATEFQVPSTQGYTVGSKLQLLEKVSASYYKLINPINLGYRKIDGSCQTNGTTDSSESLVDLVFGKNAMYTCYGSSSNIGVALEELMSTNALYVGRFGSAGTILADYVQVQWNSIQTSQSAQLLFYYVKVGEESNYQYQITNAKVSPLTTKNSQSTLYVEYIEMANTAQLYIPPPPTIDAYLPNDFLAPFYVAG